ncbi:hypothetical protein [Priestia megaterium]|uniref:hypothetical protein n=1 Tax=Priestia megaterium TaxID=1404 RepID=UPI00112CDFE2|nr:hypothetical protein [Priestia megaterium]TPF18056.1 hypothetical protein CBE78_02175 [Priestia megaterium]TPF22163.1 hypothetical protein CBE79_04680 [Priestia megaterium]
MIIEKDDLVFISGGEKKEAIGYYGKVMEVLRNRKVKVLYRHTLVCEHGVIDGDRAIFNLENVSLVAKAKGNKSI